MLPLDFFDDEEVPSSDGGRFEFILNSLTALAVGGMSVIDVGVYNESHRMKLTRIRCEHHFRSS